VKRIFCPGFPQFAQKTFVLSPYERSGVVGTLYSIFHYQTSIDLKIESLIVEIP